MQGYKKKDNDQFAPFHPMTFVHALQDFKCNVFFSPFVSSSISFLPWEVGPSEGHDRSFM